MIDTVSSNMAGVAGELTRSSLNAILRPIADRMSSQATSSAGLVISATTTKAKIGAVAFAGVAKGVPVAIAAGTDMPALPGTITAGSYNVYCFFIDSASVVTVKQGIEGTTLAKVKFPQFPEGQALVGYLVITYASTFTGGSTVLSTATTVYVSPVGAFDPSIIL